MTQDPVNPIRSKQHLNFFILVLGILGLVSCGLVLSIPRSVDVHGITDQAEEPLLSLYDDTTLHSIDFNDNRTLDRLSDKDLGFLLSKDRIGAINSVHMHSIGRYLVDRAIARGNSVDRRIQAVLPENSEILAMLARDRDLDDYIEHAAEDGAAGQYYQAVVDLVPQMKPLRTHYEKLFSGIFEGMRLNNHIEDPLDSYPMANEYTSGVTLPRLSTKPRESEYDLSHTYALDIFLKDIERNFLAGVEKGPVIFSLSEGLVVSVDSSWSGGEDLSKYRNGGITPKAGNGAIVYSPKMGRFFLYFHLHDVFLAKGNAITSGQPIGHGGNSGTNARKQGHGEHLHLEIYDSKTSSFLKNKDIARFVFGR